jgi:uncharacterized membrane protein YgdD (TMEM256/DUF423 family)
MPIRSRNFLIIAGILLALGTALGAFGAHALKPRLAAAAFEAYESAVLYHLVNALGLAIIALTLRDLQNAWLRWSARLVLLGIVLFAGSLYGVTFGAPRMLGAVTPLGGVALMAGWASFALGVWRAAIDAR